MLGSQDAYSPDDDAQREHDAGKVADVDAGECLGSQVMSNLPADGALCIPPLMHAHHPKPSGTQDPGGRRRARDRREAEEHSPIV